jgi:lysylphosphatidylglycerol synthetase-like protein (DUF2156 family)
VFARLLRRARTIPFTWVIVALTLAAGLSRLFLGSQSRIAFDEFVSTGFDSVVVEHHWLSAITSVFFVPTPLIVILIVVMLGAAERLMGTLRTILVYTAVTILGTGIGVGLQALALEIGDSNTQALRAHHIVDAFLPLVGTLLAASAFANPLLRRRIRILGFAGLIMFVLYSGQPSDLYRLVAAVVGLILGILLVRGRRVRVGRSSHREIRTLVASIVAISAVGPLITIVTPTSFGPLKPLGLLFKSVIAQGVDTAQDCGAADFSRACVEQSVLSRLDGIGPVLLSILPLVALLVAAYGIVRGRRIGLWLAIVINVFMGAIAAIYYGLFPQVSSEQFFVNPNGRFDEYHLFIVVAILVPLLTAVLLVLCHRYFPTDFRGDSPWVFFGKVGGAFVALSALYLAVAWLAKEQFEPVASFTQLMIDLPERFIPVGYLTYERIDLEPVGPAALIAYLWVGPVFWFTVIGLAVAGIFKGRLGHHTDDQSKLIQLLHNGAGASLSWMTTWPGHHYWFSQSGDAAVAYRVISGIALATGEPVCSPATKPRVLKEFAEFCTNHGWTPVYYSVGVESTATLEQMHWSLMEVAEETVIHPLDWSLAGKKMQDIRSSINRANAAGVSALWTRYVDLTAGQSAQIREISEAWMADRELPEMGFTLGGLDELIDPEVALMLGVDAEGRIHAVTSWLPTFENDVVVGWTLDFMRRRADSMPGLMEFIIAQSVLRARDNGIRFMSLSGAPLAQTESGDGTDDELTAGLLRFLGRALEPVYGFQSLHSFKKKFRPELRPLYLAYPDPLALPAIGIAVARAYVPTMSSRQALQLLRQNQPVDRR